MIESNKPNAPKDFLINSNESKNIIKIILQEISVYNILHQVNPKLGKYFLSRTNAKEQTDKSEKANNPYLSLFLGIPSSKLTNEEKFLLAFFTPKNFENDLPDLLSYIAEMHKRFLIVNKSNTFYILGHNKQILRFVVKQASEHFYSSKLKVFISEDQEDEEFINNLEPMSEEETQQSMMELMKHPLFMTEIPTSLEDFGRQ